MSEIDDLNRSPRSRHDREFFSYERDSEGKIARRVKVTDVVDVNLSNTNIQFDLADGAVSAVKAIYKTINGVAHADKDTSYATATVIGVSVIGASSGNQVKYQIAGRLEDSFFNFPLNDPLYLDASGSITNVVPTTGHRTRIGTSLGVGAIEILIEEPIIL